jgi:hypothetical protein
MRLHVGEIWYAYVPYNDGPFGSEAASHATGKRRPVVILGWSRPGQQSSDDVVLVVPITSFGGGSHSVDGDIPLDDWKKMGLTKKSWIRARRLYSMAPRSLDEAHGQIGAISNHTLDLVYREISALLTPGE